MRVSCPTMLGSLLVAVACVVAAGCDDSGGDAGFLPPPGLSPTPQKVAIDTGATIDITPGNGVGVFVQYAAGGHYTISTACDTNVSQFSCNFDVFVSGVDRATTLSNPQGQNLEGPDSIDLQRDGTLHFYANTSTGLDGVSFDATPGATIEVEMYLDTQPQPRFVYWIGDAVLHTGAPTDPIDFTPTAN